MAQKGVTYAPSKYDAQLKLADEIRKTKPDSAYAIAKRYPFGRKTKFYTMCWAMLFNIIGLINDAKDKYKDALKYFTEALSYYQKPTIKNVLQRLIITWAAHGIALIITKKLLSIIKKLC
jgi:tetratricopeptide (TPR) repeat protein